jgi:hypothetical protein
MKLLQYVIILALLSFSNVNAETKLELNLLFDVANIMSTTTRKSFCITVLTDLIVEPNNKKENHVPLMILGFDTADATIEEAQVTCPNLIIGDYMAYALN